MGQVILKRVLTYRSFLKFGKWAEYRVQELIALRRDIQLVSPYFNLSSIDFIPEVLDELGITEEYRIKKPGTDKDLYYKFLENGKHRIPKPKTRNMAGSDKLRGKQPMISRGQDAWRNQGNRVN